MRFIKKHIWILSALVLLCACGQEGTGSNVIDSSNTDRDGAFRLNWDYAIESKDGGLFGLANTEGLGQGLDRAGSFVILSNGVTPPAFTKEDTFVTLQPPESPQGKERTFRKVTSSEDVMLILIQGDPAGEWKAFTTFYSNSEPAFTSAQVRSINGEAPAEYLQKNTVKLPGVDSMYLIKGKEGETVSIEKDDGTENCRTAGVFYSLEEGEEKKIALGDEVSSGLWKLDVAELGDGIWSVENGNWGQALFEIGKEGGEK